MFTANSVTARFHTQLHVTGHHASASILSKSTVSACNWMQVIKRSSQKIQKRRSSLKVGKRPRSNLLDSHECSKHFVLCCLDTFYRYLEASTTYESHLHTTAGATFSHASHVLQCQRTLLMLQTGAVYL